jgi:hypothetical protein
LVTGDDTPELVDAGYQRIGSALAGIWRECISFLLPYLLERFSSVRAGELTPILPSLRNEAACWNQSVTCSTLSTTLKD